MKKVFYICAPYRADTPEGVQANINRAVEFGKAVLRAGHIPIIVHLPTLAMWGLDTRDGRVDKEIIEHDMKLLDMCDALLVCGDRVSKGMQAEIDHCGTVGKDIFRMMHPGGNIVLY